ncbi:67_t:CDS:2 [Acaulospora colombiana]|uniref:67_t:CDS:1 n=1 Tax=Acaulospora colombiana TaxID=27376 RepID=A0ACA9K6D5_9GLOM|nr:67_t:CDS:2 [Acaulospora colombiana]
MWEGPRTGVLGAVDIFGADEAMESSRFNSKIKEIIKNYETIYIDLPPRTNILSTDNVQKNINRAHGTPLLMKLSSWFNFNRDPADNLNQPHPFNISNIIGDKVRPLSKIIQDLRIIKSDAEINLMKKAGEITGKAFIQEYHGYASDITRTWPVNGKFTQAQREIYEVVLKVNRNCIKLCTEEENISLNGIHEASVQIMKEELINLGFNLVEGDVDRVLYPHHVGHYLGLDVHDTHDLDRSRRLLSGMVITIGIYIPPDDAYPKKYHGMGIRIEDNVLVGKTDPIVLSSTSPKEIVDIEYCMAN